MSIIASLRREKNIHPDAHFIDLQNIDKGWSLFKQKGQRARLREDATGYITPWYYVVQHEAPTIAPPLAGYAYGEAADIGTDDGVHVEFDIDDFVDAVDGTPASEMDWDNAAARLEENAKVVEGRALLDNIKTTKDEFVKFLNGVEVPTKTRMTKNDLRDLVNDWCWHNETTSR